MVCVMLQQRLLLRSEFISVQAKRRSDIYSSDETTQQRSSLYLVLDDVRPARAVDVGEDVRPSCRRAVPADVTCEGGGATVKSSPHQLRVNQ